MGKKDELLKEIEKGFSSYVKSALTCTSKNYFRDYNTDLYKVEEFEDIEDFADENTILTIVPSNMFYLERYLEDELLSQAINSLSNNDKRLLFMKFFEEKTDEQIAKIFGVSRQALSKSKKRILNKLKNRMKS